MTNRYISTFYTKRGRPKITPMSPHPVPTRRPTEFIDLLYQRGDITLEHRMASIFYRVLYYQVHTPLGAPELRHPLLSSLSLRFNVPRSRFTPEEREEWYREKEKAWKALRQSLVQDQQICITLIDDVIIYKATCFELHALTTPQMEMLEHALSRMTEFFGVG